MPEPTVKYAKIRLIGSEDYVDSAIKGSWNKQSVEI